MALGLGALLGLTAAARYVWGLLSSSFHCSCSQAIIFVTMIMMVPEWAVQRLAVPACR